MKVTQLCLTLCDPMDCSLPGSSVHEILQGRILEWVAISCSIISVYLFFISSMSLVIVLTVLDVSCIFSILFSSLWSIFTIIILNSLSGRLLFPLYLSGLVSFYFVLSFVLYFSVFSFFFFLTFST